MTLGNWLVFDEFLVRVDALLKDKILGLAVVDWNLMLTPGAYLAVDRYETMIYDIMDENGKHATYDHSIAVAKNYYKYLIPREKLDFGLPTYARPTDGDAYWYDWAGYYDKIDENGFYYDESIDKTFWFNSQEDFFKKTTFALDEGWGGMMIFRYKCDLPTTNENSLLLGVGDAIAQHNK